MPWNDPITDLADRKMNSGEELFDDVREEIESRLKKMAPEQRAAMMVDLYFQLPSPDEALASAFFDWFESPFNRGEKEAAMQRKFEEIMNNADLEDESEYYEISTTPTL